MQGAQLKSSQSSKIFFSRPFIQFQASYSKAARSFSVEFRADSSGWVVSDSVICVDYDWIIQIFGDFINWIAKVHLEKRKVENCSIWDYFYSSFREDGVVGYFVKVRWHCDGPGLAIKNSLISGSVSSNLICGPPFVSAMVCCRKSACGTRAPPHTRQVIVDRLLGDLFCKPKLSITDREVENVLQGGWRKKNFCAF